ncbi:peptidoglycan DD-metalloendopeptidase family protein [Paenibacillus sp. 1P07SE]|uniref:peptidoglycan DD-metalloendopeptidase family protein n=1 Tax=Paenibacillus sp. 1P07SE TaxID=3132209 RepID=UPI0039A44DE3
MKSAKKQGSKLKAQETGRPLTVNNASFQRLKRKPFWLAAAALLLVVLAGYGIDRYIQANTVTYYHLYHDGQLIGEIADPASIDELLEQRLQEAGEANPEVHMELTSGEISYIRAKGYKAEPDTNAALEALGSRLSTHAVGYEVKVDGKLIGIAKDEQTAKKVLRQVQDRYRIQSVEPKGPQVMRLSHSQSAVDASADEREVTSVEILEEIGTSRTQVDPERVTAEEELYQRLAVGAQQPISYTVQPGDCIGCIASKFGISSQVIYQNNPWITGDTIEAGAVLDLTVERPAITVQTVEEIKETIDIEPPVEVREHPELMAGTSKVVRPGQPGKKQVTFKLIKQNGYLMHEELIGEEVLQAPLSEVVYKGTKVINGEGSGTFAWPVQNARVTSSFGPRWGRMHNGIDLVGNKSILSADHGVVEFVGTRSGYGKTIIVDHKNGYKTLYAHLSGYSVQQGDIVEKGDKLGDMGNTGRSTGTHLHFEIRKNDSPQNPSKYLN